MNRYAILLIAGAAGCSAGDPPTGATATHIQALSFLPRAPFPAGQSLAPVQCFGGDFSHNGPLEYGIDYALPLGTPVLAVGPGVVEYTHDGCPNGRDDDCFHGIGNVVVVRHAPGEFSLYAHLSPGRILVNRGQQVCTGSILAESGDSGFSTGPHLHFQFQSTSGGDRPLADGYVSVPFAAWSSANGQIEPCNRLRSDNVPQQACGAPPDWWCDAIDQLHALDITDRSCGDFSVNDVFNRAEWATLISRTLQLEQSPAFVRCQNPFVDLEPGAWYVPHLSALAGLEYGDGVSVFSVPANRQAQPGNTTNRCEAVKSLVEAWNPPDRPAPRLLFSDRQAIPAWCLPYVEQAAAHTLITNRADPFAPGDALSAGAGATMLTNAIDSLGRPLPAEDDFSADLCARACEAACRVGEARCDGGNRQRCQDSGDCPGWVADPCEVGQVCEAGACIQPDQPAEACNGRDDDGDGRTDEGVRNRCGGCGAEPAEQCDRQDNDCDSRVDEEACAEPPAEACNGFDDDQDGEVDEGVCVQPGVEICNRVDDDTDGRIDEGCSPPEACNGFDDDGDGQSDEGACRPDGGVGGDCGVGECPADVVADTSSGGEGCKVGGRTSRGAPIWSLALLILAMRLRRRFPWTGTGAIAR